MKITIVANCQVHGLVACAEAMVPDAGIYGVYVGTEGKEIAKNSDIILLQTEYFFLKDQIDAWDGVDPSAFTLIPSFHYPAFHPDLVYAWIDDRAVQSPMGDYNSALVLYGWLNHLSVSETIRLFCEGVYDRLHYFDYFERSRKYMIEAGAQSGFDVSPLLDEWNKRGCFAHSINHPKLYVLSSLVRTVLKKAGVEIAMTHPEDFIHDALADSAVWPVYPDIASRLGVAGNYEFKVPRRPTRAVEILGLEEFVARSFACYSAVPRDRISVDRFAEQGERYRNLEAIAARRRPKKSSPYSDLPDFCFWRKAVSAVPASELDAVVNPKFQLARDDNIATAGSCFAQNIGNTLSRIGYNYFIAETPPTHLPPEAAATRGYGTFSARFGNIYTARQLLQLFKRAYSELSPNDQAWLRNDGRFVDPFRPHVEPDGYGTAEEVAAARVEHLAAVRTMFEECRLFVFTAGLTEAWASRSDGAVFPVAPGVVGESTNGGEYQFVNFTVAEIVADLNEFIRKLKAVNRGVRLLFTVSPVPLVATYERRHVLVSTTYSKSAIRAALDEVVRQYDFADYFPSYEIITNWYNRGAYFASDMRSVTQDGVDHVMRMFVDNYFIAEHQRNPFDNEWAVSLQNEIARSAKIICDEELLDFDAAAESAPPSPTSI